MDVYLIRHGESKGNVDRIITTDPQLTDLGVQQAINLQGVIPGGYDRVYSSNLIRTKRTAILSLNLAEINDVVRIEPDLREIEVGSNLEGLPFQDIEISREDFLKWVNLTEDTFHGKYQSEPLSEFIKRTGDVFTKIIDAGKYNNLNSILIFSHGGTMRSILTHKLRLIKPEDLSIRNTEIIHLKLENGKWNILERIIDDVKG
ncbi:MAG: histidine phosphatase family protein [Candidatus Heimdallarchaeota archaeon]|nr:histidine phosphatase family protein [Candidatus Heimdallarchaeota archaeon]